jgi:peptidoglycan/LPS O-acetylase OafA/YrhL
MMIRDGILAQRAQVRLLPLTSPGMTSSAVPSSSVRLGHRLALDGIRGVAVVLVLARHVWPEGGAGMVGVDLFFVLSGFLITCLLIEEWDERGGISFKAFYARRALRLLPALYAMLTVFVACSLLFARGDRLAHALKSAALAGTYLTGYAAFDNFFNSRPLGPVWSLAVEEQFYLLWPVILWLALRRGWSLQRCAVLAVGLAALDVVFRIVSWQLWQVRIYTLPTTWADGLFIGCAVALGWKAGLFPTRIPSALAWSGWLTLFFLGLWQTMEVSGPTYGPVLTSMAVVSAVLVLAAARGEGGLPTALLASRPVRWVGRRSYAIYLWNASLIAAVPTSWKPHVLLAVLAAVASFGVAELSWRFVESPALRRKQRFARARSEMAVPGVT